MSVCKQSAVRRILLYVYYDNKVTANCLINDFRELYRSENL